MDFFADHTIPYYGIFVVNNSIHHGRTLRTGLLLLSKWLRYTVTGLLPLTERSYLAVARDRVKSTAVTGVVVDVGRTLNETGRGRDTVWDGTNGPRLIDGWDASDVTAKEDASPRQSDSIVFLRIPTRRDVHLLLFTGWRTDGPTIHGYRRAKQYLHI